MYTIMPNIKLSSFCSLRNKNLLSFLGFIDSNKRDKTGILNFKLLYIIAIMLYVINCYNISITKASEISTEYVTKFVDSNAQKVLQIINLKEDSTIKKKQLSDIFCQVVDINWMAKFAIAKYWREITPEQQIRYISAYRNYIIISYINKFIEYNGQSYTITSIKPLGNSAYMAVMQISSPGNAEKTINITYRIKQYQDQSLKIIDIIGEGVSLLATQRTDFESIISKDGIDSFIKSLEMKSTTFISKNAK